MVKNCIRCVCHRSQLIWSRRSSCIILLFVFCDGIRKRCISFIQFYEVILHSSDKYAKANCIALFSLNSIRFPFDYKTPIGFAIGVAIEFSCMTLLMYMVVCSFGMLIGFCEIMISFSQSVQNKFHDLYDNYKINRENSEKFANDFCSMICFYSEIRELSVLSFDLKIVENYTNIIKFEFCFSHFRFREDFKSVVKLLFSLIYIYSLLAVAISLLMCQVISKQ